MQFLLLVAIALIGGIVGVIGLAQSEVAYEKELKSCLAQGGTSYSEYMSLPEFGGIMKNI